MQQRRDLTAPQQDRAKPSSVQQQRKTTVLNEPEAYSPRLDARKSCSGKGMSWLITTRSAKVRKVISEGWEDDDDGTVQAGPPMARRQCTQGQQGPYMEDGGVRSKNQDLGLSLRWKNQRSPGLLPMAAAAGLGDQEGKERGSSLFILRERKAVGFGRRGDAQDRFRKGCRKGLKGLLSSPAAGLAQLEVGFAMTQVGRVGRERTDCNKETRKNGQQGEGRRG
jgi:hypothetical protein